MGELERRELGFRSLTGGVDTTTSSGRLVFHIFGAIAEFERRLIRERTQAGLSLARARGRRGGRRTVMTEHKLRIARQMLADDRHTMQEIADTIGVGRATLYRHLESIEQPTHGSSPKTTGRQICQHRWQSLRPAAGATQVRTPLAHERHVRWGVVLETCPVRVDRISAGDIVKASIKGRTVYGEVGEVADGIVHFLPLTHAAGWRHASAHEIVSHWRKTRRAGGSGEPRATAALREQLSLPGIYD